MEYMNIASVVPVKTWIVDSWLDKLPIAAIMRPDNEDAESGGGLDMFAVLHNHTGVPRS